VRRRDAAAGPVDTAHAEAYLRMIRDQQRMGLRQLRGEEGDADGGEEEDDEDAGEGKRKAGVAAGSSLGHRVDPRELEPGEYVVHKKVGVGKFACISAEDGVDYVFIQYADAMAKLAVDQAARMLYRYNLYASGPTHCLFVYSSVSSSLLVSAHPLAYCHILLSCPCGVQTFKFGEKGNFNSGLTKLQDFVRHRWQFEFQTFVCWETPIESTKKSRIEDFPLLTKVSNFLCIVFMDYCLDNYRK
jgi:hypothetical protein